MFQTEHEFDPIEPTIIIKANFGPDTTSSKEMYQKLINDLGAGINATCKLIPRADGAHAELVIDVKPIGAKKEEPIKSIPPPTTKPIPPPPGPIKTPPPPVKPKTPQEILAESIAKGKGK